MTTTWTVSNSLTPLLSASVRVLVHTNVFISLSAASVALSTMLLADLPVDPVALFIVFAVTMFVYSYNRIADLAEDSTNTPGRAAFVRRYGTALLGVGAALYALATAVAIVERVPGAPAMVIPLAVVVLYSVVGLKRVLLVKNLLVGLSWGLIPLGVGVYAGALASVDVLFVAGFVTAMLTVAAAVFDIKDIEGDSAAGISTLPVRYGPAVTRRLAVGATVAVSLALVALVAAGVLAQAYAALLVFTAYVAGYSLVATPDHGPLFYGFVVDGEHVFLASVLVVVEAAG